MTTITEDLRGPGNTQPIVTHCVYDLVDDRLRPIRVFVDGDTLVGPHTARPDSTGMTTVELERNDEMLPTGTRWRLVRHMPRNVTTDPEYLNVDEDGTFRVDEKLSVAPATIIDPAVAQSVADQIAADVVVSTAMTSTYVAKAGSTMSGDLSVPHEAYGVAWDSSLEVPTKNAVYDKIEALAVGPNTSQAKDAVRVASTASVTIATPGASIDSVALSAGDRVLLMGNGAQNGIYAWNGAAVPMTRTTDADTAAELKPGSTVWVAEGTLHGKTRWQLTTPEPVTLNTTTLTFQRVTSNLIGDTSTAVLLGVRTTSDANNRLEIRADGTIWSAPDALAVPIQAVWFGASAASLNMALGRGAGNTTLLTGTRVTAVGRNALAANTSGGTNTALGTSALAANTTASNNTAVGAEALLVNTTGANLTAVGSRALDANTTGSNNTAVGGGCLGANTTGHDNVGVGTSCLSVNTTGFNNVAVGPGTLAACTTGADNTAVGGFCLNALTDGIYNTAVGITALGDCTSGSYNIGIGRYALEKSLGLDANACTTGSYNFAAGNQAGFASGTQRDNTISLGHAASVDGNEAIAIGHLTQAWAAGAVAIGTDSGGAGATTSTANTIALGTGNHTLSVIGNASIGGAAKSIGFYGATPVAKQTGVAVTAAGIHAALVSLGLIAA